MSFLLLWAVRGQRFLEITGRQVAVDLHHRGQRGTQGRDFGKHRYRRVSLKAKPAIATLVLVVILSIVGVAQVSSSQIDGIFATLKSSDAPGAAVLVIP